MTDIGKLIELLETSGRAFVASYAGVSDEQFRYKPGPDRWSIAENVEHLTTAEMRASRLISERIIAEPASAELLAGTEGGEQRIERALRNREARVSAPEIVQPKGRWTDAAEMTSVFETNRAATIAFLRTTEYDLSKYVFPHPILGTLNGYQWARAGALHGLRHAAQIEEVKRSPGYPSS